MAHGVGGYCLYVDPISGNQCGEDSEHEVKLEIEGSTNQTLSLFFCENHYKKFWKGRPKIKVL